jgi:hypothetical protein
MIKILKPLKLESRFRERYMYLPLDGFKYIIREIGIWTIHFKLLHTLTVSLIIGLYDQKIIGCMYMATSKDNNALDNEWATLLAYLLIKYFLKFGSENKKALQFAK